MSVHLINNLTILLMAFMFDRSTNQAFNNLTTMRQQGQYTHSGVSTYAGNQMHQMSTQRMEEKLGPFEGRLEAFTPEREHPYGTSNAEGRWKWERDGSKVSNSVASYMSNEGKCYFSVRMHL